MENILITGGSGFIGKKVIDQLCSFKNINIINLSTVEIEGIKNINHKNYTFTKEEIPNIDTVLHLGAFIPKEHVQVNLYTENNLNIKNTEYLMVNLPNLPRKFIFISTVDVYEISDESYSEISKVNPQSLYGLSKYYCEKMLESWANINNVHLQILRLGHIYGEGEEAYKKLLPVTIQKVLKNEQPVIYTDGKEKRSFLHVEDCANLIVNSINLQEIVGVINVVTAESYSVIDYVNKVIKYSGVNLKPLVLDQYSNARSLTFDATKMLNYLGEPQINLEEGLKREISYFKNLMLEKGL